MGDNLNTTPDSCSKLTEIANQQRQELLIINTYSDNNGKRYSSTHPNATQESTSRDPLNIKGKGTGIEFDFSEGGGFYDVNGKPSEGSYGRNGINIKNKFTPDTPYRCIIE